MRSYIATLAALLIGQQWACASTSMPNQAIIKERVSSTTIDARKQDITFFPAEVVSIKDKTPTSVLVQVSADGMKRSKGPAWIPLHTIALPGSFQPVTKWGGETVASVCSGSCDGGIGLFISNDGTFRLESYDGNEPGTKTGHSTGKLFKNGQLIWARKATGRGNFDPRMSEHFSYRLRNDGRMCFIEYEEVAKDGCVCNPVGEGPAFPCDENDQWLRQELRP